MNEFDCETDWVRCAVFFFNGWNMPFNEKVLHKFSSTPGNVKVTPMVEKLREFVFYAKTSVIFIWIEFKWHSELLTKFNHTIFLNVEKLKHLQEYHWFKSVEKFDLLIFSTVWSPEYSAHCTEYRMWIYRDYRIWEKYTESILEKEKVTSNIRVRVIQGSEFIVGVQCVFEEKITTHWSIVQIFNDPSLQIQLIGLVKRPVFSNDVAN